ncbi:MAG: hypothetical protein HFE57_09230 [Firmicutes bacterium]|jgi:hypothetical protein|nr:hypothetical protein [Bacillota bacterium]
MYECKQCHIKIKGNIKCCPLCQSELHGTPEQNVFPVIHMQPPLSQKMFRMGLFITLVALAVCVGINLSRPQDGWWVLFVLAGSACFWFSVSIAMKKWHNIPKNILWQFVILSILAVFWDIKTGYRGWSLNYVLPFLCIGAIISTTLLAYILKLHTSEYILYLMLDAISALIPLILLLKHKLNVLYPSAICVSVSMIVFGVLFLFRRDLFFSEIQRRTHL